MDTAKQKISVLAGIFRDGDKIGRRTGFLELFDSDEIYIFQILTNLYLLLLIDNS